MLQLIKIQGWAQFPEAPEAEKEVSASFLRSSNAITNMALFAIFCTEYYYSAGECNNVTRSRRELTVFRIRACGRLRQLSSMLQGESFDHRRACQRAQ